MNTKEEYITLKEFADRAGITTAAIHQSKKLKPYIRKNTKPQTISIKALNLYDISPLVSALVSLSKDKPIENSMQNESLSKCLSKDNDDFTKDNEILSKVDNNIEISNKTYNILEKELQTIKEQFTTLEKHLNNQLTSKEKELNDRLKDKDEYINYLKEELKEKDLLIKGMMHLTHESNQKVLQEQDKKDQEEIIIVPEEETDSVEEVAVIKEHENKRPGFLRRLFNQKGDIE